MFCSLDLNANHFSVILSFYNQDILDIIKEEWFFVSSSPSANPDNIRAFAREMRSVSSNVLSKVVNSLDDTVGAGVG